MAHHLPMKKQNIFALSRYQRDLLRICQLLERLVFPPQQTSLLLHLALPADADAAQPPCFAQNLRALEAEVWKEGDGRVEPGLVEAVWGG